MDKNIVAKVLKRCLAHRDGESLVVVTDSLMEQLARGFHEAAVELGVPSTLVSMPARKAHGEEPTEAVAAAMKQSDIAVLLTSTSLTHTQARREATATGRVRIASMPGVDPTRLPRLLDFDYDAHERRCEEIGGQLDGEHEIRLTSRAGTDLTFRIGGRTVYRDAGRLDRPGSFGNLPCGEVCLAPIEGSGNGVVVVDGSVAGLGVVRDPVRITVRDGRAVEISDPRLRQMLEAAGADGLMLAEFGIGTNPNAEIVGNAIEDEKAVGTAHVAFGANASMGGKVQVPVHIDLILTEPAVFVDGRVMPEKLIASRPPTRRGDLGAPPSLDLAAVGMFEEFFDHANDALYVLDIETQRFLAVNRAFTELTGWSREEALSGEVTAPKLVARESMTTFKQKRESRRFTPSERYDLKLLCKDGTKRPVELSVRRLVIRGRDVVLGSMRDLTARKRMEQEMWEKIEELGFANQRIFALTEKIQSVPDLASALLPVTREEELLQRAAELMCARAGLGYVEVTFWLVRGDVLEMAHSTVHPGSRRIRLDTDARHVQVLQGRDPGEVTRQSAILPLRGRERNLGVLEVAFHPKEVGVLEGSPQALKGYQDLLLTLSNVMGLLIENLHLYETVRLQSIVDQVTGVFNRRWFDQKLTEELHRASRYSRDLALMLIDLDHFKQVNDLHSHQQGDLVLVECARIFRLHTREVDVVCRIGGDEFAVILPETTYEGALQKGELLRAEVASALFQNLAGGPPVRLSLSIGVASRGDGVSEPADLMKQADEALYAAKHAGRNAVSGYRPVAK